MKKLLFITVISFLFLASCNAVRKSAGVNRKVIDEYTVVENPPLVIPPNFNLLPPEQIESKNLDDVDSELAKEIMFGLDDNENLEKDDSLINIIVQETGGDEIDDNIRDNINQEFAGEKSTEGDEIKFENEDELNKAIEDSQKVDNKSTKKKKKRFFFF